MAKRKKRRNEVQFHIYECTLSGEKFRVNSKAESPGDLVSVNAFYEMNPELDDRPEAIKAKLAAKNKVQQGPQSKIWEELLEIAEKQQMEREQREAARREVLEGNSH